LQVRVRVGPAGVERVAGSVAVAASRCESVQQRAGESEAKV